MYALDNMVRPAIYTIQSVSYIGFYIPLLEYK